MGFLEDLAKNLALWGAVQASKDANGKPDPYKAAGIAAGMGNFSASDGARLGAMLGSEGAFDDDHSDYCGGSSDCDDAGWKLYCEDGSEYGLDPDDFDTEEEYEEALEEALDLAKEEANKTVEVKATDTISIPVTLGVSISGGSKKEESKPQATNREQYAWRRYYKKEEKYGLNTYNFEKESDFLRALYKKKQEALEIALNDKNIYHYCAVVYDDNPYPYHYRTNDISLKIGDKVVVPVGRENVEKIAEIVSVEQHTRLTVPYPVEKMKTIIRKHVE